MKFPSLTKLNKLSETIQHKDLSNVVLVAVQHLLASNGSLLEALNSLGLPYEQMFILGKAYSVNEDVVAELKERGAYVHPKSSSVDQIGFETDYKQYLSDIANEVLTKALDKLDTLGENSQLLLIDDGGVLIDVANGKLAERNVVAVEQTRSGAEIVRSLQTISMPVINVAESRLKLVDESPLIAESIINETNKRLVNLPHQPRIKDSSVLVVGLGAVGSEVAKLLQKDAKEVIVYDLNPGLADNGLFAFEELEDALRKCNFIFGCVGKKWLPNNYKELMMDGVILASGSSSNTEFLGLDINKDYSPITSQKRFNDPSLDIVHSDYPIQLLDNRTGWVLNGGFPVNFDGSIEPIEASVIELTRMLMFAGICQALSYKSENSLVPLDDNLQNTIKELY